MSTQSRDTHPQAERVQIELLRRQTVAQRLELGLSFCQSISEIARAGIRQAHPLANQEEREMLFVEVNYGKELANRVRAYLRRKADD